MAVQALVRREPANPVLEAAVRYLLVSRQSGVAWLSTKQTAMVLYGLLDYMKARGEAAGPVTAEVRVNGAAVRTVAFPPLATSARTP